MKSKTELSNHIYNLYHHIPEKYRYGKTYRHYRKFIKDSQIWSTEDIQDWQFDQLKKIITNAYETTNYYRTKLDRNNLHPLELKTIVDVHKIPYLEKSEINDNINDFVSRKVKKKNLVYASTSGTSGVPVVFYLPKDQKAIEMAFVHDIWSKYGHKENKKHAHLRGYILKNKLYEIKGKNLILSSFHLDQNNIFKYISIINDFKPDYLQAYPSSAASLCRLINEYKIEPPKSIKLILCSSENLYKFQEELIQKTFRIPVGNLYGHSESSVIAYKCPQSEFYHFYPQYGFVELINDKGEYAKSEGEMCEIVATSFVNSAFPMIRYRTGDFGTMTRKKCPCGWNYISVSSIVGRNYEFILKKNNVKLPVVLFATHYKFFTDIKNFQFYQDKAGLVEFRYVPKRNLSDLRLSEIKDEIQFVIGEEIDIKLVQVNSVEVKNTGKIPFLVQKLSM